MKLESILEYLDGYLGAAAHPDYPNAFNGLQVEGPGKVTRVCTAVDASEAAITEAVDRQAHLLMVHHGLFWDGLRPLTGRRHSKIARLIRGDLGVYSMHLPLDAHAEIGNCILLARALDIRPVGRFGSYQGADLGWWGESSVGRKQLVERAQVALGGPIQLLPYGPEQTERVGVIVQELSERGYRKGAARLGALVEDPATPGRCRRLAEARFGVDGGVKLYHELYEGLSA